MKKTVFAVSLLLMMACSKTTEKLPEKPTVATLPTVTKEVLATKSPTDMNEMSMLLTYSERDELWKKKFELILQNDGDRLTENQLTIVRSLNDMLSRYGTEGLSKDTTVGQSFLESNLDFFNANFTKPQLFLLIECPYVTDDFSIFNAEDILASLESREKGPHDCTCRYNLGCPGANNDCEWGGCDKTGGCGVFGTSSCKGRCDTFQPSSLVRDIDY